MVQFRREQLDVLAGQVTDATAGLGTEERVLARERVVNAALQAHGDVIASMYGNHHGTEAGRFFDYLDNSYRDQRDRDRAQPDAEPTPARRLAAEMVASDNQLNQSMGLLQRRAEYYIAHQVTVAAQRDVRSPQAPAAAALGAAAGPVAAPVAAVKAGIQATKTPPIRHRPPSIG